MSVTKGIQYAVGFTAPQILIQVCPLYWGVSVSWTRAWKGPLYAFAVELGPLALKVQWLRFKFEKHGGRFEV